MSINPFKPPESDSPKNPLPPAGPNSPVKAVLLGLAVDVGGSLAVGIVISVMYAIQLHGQGLSEAEIRDAMGAMPHDSALYMSNLLLGISLSVLGGFVCARVARRGEYRAGVIMAAASCAFGLLSGGASVEADSMTLLLAVTGFACNLLGVKFGVDVNRRTEASTGPDKDAPTP